ncbi:MAG: hypothetical protein PHI66_00910 [Candidatus Pacebacteria bacterium]|nr:hypothetical protein [Candidatus Paceibacterota bacterium]
MKNFFKKENEQKVEEYLTNKDTLTKDDYFSAAPENRKKKIGAVLILGLFFIAIIFAYLSFSKGHGSFNDSKIGISYEISEGITSGEETSLIVSCSNNNDVDINETKLEISLPDSFIMTSNDKGLEKSGKMVYWNIGRISAGNSEKIRIFGRFIGQTGDKATISSNMTYVPLNFNSKFQTAGSTEIYISFSPIKLTMEEKSSVPNQSEEDFVFEYENESDRSFSKIEINIDTGESFVLVSSSLDPIKIESGIISFEDTEFVAGEKRELLVRGIFDSEQDQEKMKAELYILEENGEMIKYAETERELKIEKSDIMITQTVNGGEGLIAGKNEELEYRISFKNQSGKEIKGLILETYLNGNFDESSIETENGTVNGNKIVWSAMKINGLAVLKDGEEGSVSFKVKVKDYFDITSAENKNFILESSTSVSVINYEEGSNNIKTVLASNNLETKVKAFLYVEAKGFFNDDGRIENEGALPPQAGKKTSYTVHLIAKNFFNDTKNIKIAAKLADNVDFTGKYINSDNRLLYQDPKEADKNTADTVNEENNSANIINEENETEEEKQQQDMTEEKIYYDAENREIVWEIPRMKANDGILNSTKEIIFQIEIEPQEENIGNAMTMISRITASAFDEFIEQEIKYQIDGIDTLLEDDYSIGEGEAIVTSSTASNS